MTGDERRHDLIVIGAGINGAAVAREAALAGAKVAIFEQSDVGGGTSAASTRLIHGGLRYLEHAEFSLVRESLRERERLFSTAPHLVEPLELLLPLYSGRRRKPWQIRFGLSIYDLLSFDRSVRGHRMLDRSAVRDRLPSLADEGLLGAASYYDAQVTFPERLVLENVIDAVESGAELRTHTRVTRVRVDQGTATGVEWQSAGSAGFTPARAIVNAAGPWVDAVLAGLESQPRLVGGTKGSHIVVRPFDGAPNAAVYSEARSDGRPFFVIPWNGLYLIGTTDERYDGDPALATISDVELHYLVKEAEGLFPGARGLAQNVLYTQAGIRPLPFTATGDEGAITRRHLIKRHAGAEGLLSIVGGKLTTHRALAEDVMRQLARRLPGLARRSPTRTRMLPGALGRDEAATFRAELAALLGPAQAERLWRIYGRRAERVADRAQEAPQRLGQVVGPNSNVLVAELVHAVESEWASTLVDIVHRRCMAGLGADFGLATAPAAAQWLVRLGHWDKKRAAAEIVAYRDFARRWRVKSVPDDPLPPLPDGPSSEA